MAAWIRTTINYFKCYFKEIVVDSSTHRCWSCQFNIFFFVCSSLGTLNDQSSKIHVVFASNKIVWDWGLSKEEETLIIVHEALHFGGESSPKCIENDDSLTSIDLESILCEQRKCRQKVEENDIRIIAFDEQIRLLQEEAFKGLHKWASSSYRTPTPSKVA